MPKPFRYIEPTFFSGLFDDPLLLIYVRPLGRCLLFDCGQMHHLAKRVLKSIDAIFVSHAHMDHFMGMDIFIRHSHVSPRTIDVFGPPGIARKMEYKFSAYDWNLADTFWGNFRVAEIDGHRITTTVYRGPDAFAPTPEGVRIGEIYGNRFLKVESALCEHRIPVLAYRITETPAFMVDDARMAAAGVLKGAWIKDLERLFHTGTMEAASLTYHTGANGRVEEATTSDAAAFYERIRRMEEPASVGYLTDIGYSEENLERVERLLSGVTLLICECAFLAADQEKAAASRHLCTTNLNRLLERLRPRYVVPMHLSKGYLENSVGLYREIEPPPGVTVIKLPDRLTPRPIMTCEVPSLFGQMRV